MRSCPARPAGPAVGRWGRPLLLAAALSATLGVWSLLAGGDRTPLAFACGLGNTPTMLANQEPALFYPVTRNIPEDQPVGLFALTYVQSQPIAFGEDLSRVPNAPVPTTLQWRWLFGDGATATDIAPTHRYARAGTYNVHVQIFDTTSASWTDLDSAQISILATPLPNPPIAKASASTHAIPVGGSVTFDAGGSRAQDGSALTCGTSTTATPPRGRTSRINLASRGGASWP